MLLLNHCYLSLFVNIYFNIFLKDRVAHLLNNREISALLFHNEAAKQWSKYGLSTCMHFTLIIHLDAFCYFCILQWSEIVQTCPLCKSSFSSIIHSVKSMDNYQQVIKFSHLYQRLLGAHIMSLVLVGGMLIPSGWKSSNIDSRALILHVQGVTKINFLLTISIHNQENMLWEYIK